MESEKVFSIAGLKGSVYRPIYIVSGKNCWKVEDSTLKEVNIAEVENGYFIGTNLKDFVKELWKLKGILPLSLWDIELVRKYTDPAGKEFQESEPLKIISQFEKQFLNILSYLSENDYYIKEKTVFAKRKVPAVILMTAVGIQLSALLEYYGVPLDREEVVKRLAVLEKAKEDFAVDFFARFGFKPTDKEIREFITSVRLSSLKKEHILSLWDSFNETEREILIERWRKKEIERTVALLKKMKDGLKNGRIYPEWNMEAKTGRMACREPNLMALPKNFSEELFNVRSVIKPERGNVFVKIDFPQLELLALSKVIEYFYESIVVEGQVFDFELEFALKKALESDVHTEVAKAFFSEKEIESNRKKCRQFAKTFIFSFLYGAKEKLKYQLSRLLGPDLTDSDVETYIRLFYQKFPDIEFYHKTVSGGGEYILPTGTKVIITKKTEALNYPVQNYASLIVYRFLKEVFAVLKRYMVEGKVKPVLFVHDEVVFECSEETAEFVKDILEKTMTATIYRHTGLVKKEKAQILERYG
ncbi:DNA polymerase [Desulfurobacterium sp.]|uniref:DNA polymerase n=1 Tax=Desulfurobacterium sp. TaxID=2004706 RepID=UPI0026098B2C|nr:DNA polymerase [Desulfurobacterium sp.]